MVPSLAASAPLPALGFPVAASGGQTLRPEAESLLRLGLSASNKYRVRPWPSVSTRPSEDVCACTIAPARPAAVVDDSVPYPLGALLLALPPVTASTPTTSAATTRRLATEVKRFMVRSSDGEDG